MKKFIAIGLLVCLAVTLLASCGEPTPAVETTAPRVQKYNVEDNILKTCIGQSDENGVYRVPDTVEMIAEGAFGGDTTLKEVVIGKNVKTIGSGAFQGCTSLRKVTIEEGVTTIGSFAFYGCISLQTVNLPKTVTELLPYTFYHCEALETLDLSAMTKIGDSAMMGCSSLEAVKLSSALTTIGGWAFAECRTLEDIPLENCTALAELSDFSLSGCTILTKLVIPENVKRIGAFAFYNCKRLGEISIPSGVEVVDYCAFNYTPWYLNNTEPYLIVGNGILIKCTVKPAEVDLDGKSIRYIGAAFWNAITDDFPEEYGYKYANELESIVIPEGVTAVGAYAFKGCHALKSVTLPSTLTHIESSAFNIYIDGLDSKTVVTPLLSCPNLSYIGEFAFYGCSGMEDVSLPASVRFVGNYAFAATGAFEKFYETASASDDPAKHTFITGDGVLLFAYVPDNVDEVVVPNGVKVVGGGAYCGWDNALYISEEEKDSLSVSGRSKHNLTYAVKKLTLPEGLEVICENAFFRMSQVGRVVFPDSLRVIGKEAFAFCSELDVRDSAKVTEIGDSAFAACLSIESFTFSEDVTKLGAGIFVDCAALRSVSFPKGMAFPGEDHFTAACSSLQELIVDSSARPVLYSILGIVGQDVKVRYYINK